VRQLFVIELNVFL